MVINQSRLRAGILPLTPIYSDWQEAYRHLARTVRREIVEFIFIFRYFSFPFQDQLKRGSGLFNRPALGPVARSFDPLPSRINA